MVRIVSVDYYSYRMSVMELALFPNHNFIRQPCYYYYYYYYY